MSYTSKCSMKKSFIVTLVGWSDIEGLKNFRKKYLNLKKAVQ